MAFEFPPTTYYYDVPAASGVGALTQANPGGAVYSNLAGGTGLQIAAPPSPGNDELRCAYKAATNSVTGAVLVYAPALVTLGAGFGFGGIYLRNSTTGRMITLLQVPNAGTWRIKMGQYTSYNNWTADIRIIEQMAPAPTYMKLQLTNGGADCEMLMGLSWDPTDLISWGSAVGAGTTLGTPDEGGVFISGRNVGGGSFAYIRCFQLTTT